MYWWDRFDWFRRLRSSKNRPRRILWMIHNSVVIHRLEILSAFRNRFRSLLTSDFKYSFAPRLIVTTTLRSGFVNIGRAMITSSVHPLRYRWSGQKIHSLTLRVMYPNVCFYRRKKIRTTHTRSSVIVPELDLIHCITVHDRLSKVRLITWRRSLTRDWLGRSVSVKKKNDVWSLWSVSQSTIRRRSSPKGITQLCGFLIWVARKWTCEVLLINVSYQAANLEKTN